MLETTSKTEQRTTEHRTTMNAVVCNRYGPPNVLELQEVDKPVPKDNEVLVRVKAASVNALDSHMLKMPFIFRIIFRTGVRRPKQKIWGVDLAGQVEAVGQNVTQFKPGDDVFGSRGGAFAEYVSVSENKLAYRPANATFEQAAAIPVAALTALQALRDKGKIQPGQKVLINGASGGVGTFAIQIAKSFGAEVTAVCSPRNVEQARSLGADHVIDYTKEDFTKSEVRYDLLFDNAGNHSLSACRNVLVPNGILLLVGIAGLGGFTAVLARMIMAALSSKFVSQKMPSFIANITKEDLVAMKELIEAGKVTPVIDRRYPLNEAADAVGYMAEGHARAKIVIALDASESASLPTWRREA